MVDSEDVAVVVRWLMVLGSVVVIVLFVLAVLGIFPPRSEPTIVQTPWGPLTLPRLGPEPHLPSNATEPPPFGVHDFPGG